jgi:hypothetical protein
MVTITELTAGTRACISEREFAQLRGRSPATLQKERVSGRGPEFLKDPDTGSVSYAAQTVLDFLNRGQLCHSTREYDTSVQQGRLVKARDKRKSNALVADIEANTRSG